MSEWVTSPRAAPPALEQFFQERGNVVPATIEDRTHHLRTDAVERAPAPLDIRQARAIRLDHQNRRIEPRPHDRGVAVYVDRGQIEDDEREVLPELIECRAHPRGFEEGG